MLGCRFHLGQSWYRHIKYNFPNLKQEYRNKSEKGKWIRKFFGLAFLDPSEVSDAFSQLISVAPSEECCSFADYILENYVDEEAPFSPNIWAELPSCAPRTTNGAE